jgi:uncharacterized membrane protein
MKIVSCVVAILGVLALVLAVVEKLFGINILSTSPAGYLRGAVALYLLALVVMVHDKCYGCCKEQPKEEPPKT